LPYHFSLKRRFRMQIGQFVLPAFWLPKRRYGR
jgi:hypothetical protein